MTREELKNHCKEQVEKSEKLAKYKGEEPYGKIYEEHKLILELLEQEPCEDAISREEAIDACNQSVNILEATDRIKDLPPVTPQEPFMNKPCVAHQVCHEDKVKILDKIRAEITEYAIPDFEYHGCGGTQKIVELEDVLEIIDKYK